MLRQSVFQIISGQPKKIEICTSHLIINKFLLMDLIDLRGKFVPRGDASVVDAFQSKGGPSIPRLVQLTCSSLASGTCCIGVIYSSESVFI